MEVINILKYFVALSALACEQASGEDEKKIWQA